MGSYLSEPVCAKESTDEQNDTLKCGASSMQGWRATQEDAHNCILDYDKNAAFFAVYDGHGGHEVAQYCAQKLPDFIKESDKYKQGQIGEALTEGFLGFDATIATEAVHSILKEIAGIKEGEEDDEDDENVNHLYEEATMPIEKVIWKYQNLVAGQKIAPNLNPKKGEPSSSASAGSSATEAEPVSSTNDADTSSSTTAQVPDIKVTEASTPDQVHQNGDVSESKAADIISSSNGDLKGKKKAVLTAVEQAPKAERRSPRQQAQLYKSLLQFDEAAEEESSDEEDQTFEGPKDGASDDEDDEEEEEQEDGVNSALAREKSSSDEEEDGDDGDDEEDDEDDDEDEDEYENFPMSRGAKEEPGVDSGCTAVVAYLSNKKLYVANAGDSRCIVCRDGRALEMSFDHKPEDEEERNRVVKAGGQVSSDGRVNGGLNLSRAIGDHAYKQNKDLSDREQMITALPDIKTLDLDPKDEFMVLACDGIWNFMSSQEVVDFVRARIEQGMKLSLICEEMFDHCLAPNTMGDGTGCDNMTAIIVQFAKSNKRPGDEDIVEDAAKRPKTDSSCS